MTLLARRPELLRGGPVRDLLRDLETDAAQHGVKPRLALAIAAFPPVGGFLVLLTFAYKPLFTWILREDHPVEWSQFALDMITAAAAAMTAATFTKHRQWLPALTFAGLSVGAFVLGGEEISWGQRAFAFTTPSDMAAENVQGEFNLHNLEGAGGGLDIAQLLRLTELAIGLGGVLLPLLVATSWGPLRRVGYLRAIAPPLFVVPGFGIAFLIRLLDLALRAVGSVPGALVYYLEWGELGLDLGLTAMALCARAPLLPRTAANRFLLPADDADGTPTPLTTGTVVVIGVILAATAGLVMMTTLSGILPGNVRG